ncbi:MAG TPA: T9SS type A sorting domain-containing protein [Bacteroidales bacterium]|nr:T9SS type A sorting domain-containing protein [Bacteroidales bacterium]HOR81693.1 T9SS type A sorting domain-containing protein [Bacteroidales bacterium]HPJ91035.1 T9SS type A sorting domain-containing protein [Bacteroidales bacterium]
MKKFNLFILTVLAGLIMLSVTAVKAQNMERYITLIVKQGEWIKLDFLADTDNTVVRVVSGTYDTTLDATWLVKISCYAQSDTMRIYGNVSFFNCVNNEFKITGLNASNNKGLTLLYCYSNHLSFLDVRGLTVLTDLACFDNKLSFLDVSGLVALEMLDVSFCFIQVINISGCDSLKEIYCYGNQLSACGLDSIFHQLPIRTEESKGSIYIRNTRTITNPGTSSCRDTIATNKFWNVLDYNIENEKPIKNTTYACPYFTLGVKEIKQDNIRFYPNPVNGTLYIESKADISRVEVYDVLGRRQLSTIYSNTIDCSTLSAGIYILKLTTPQGNLIKKFVKE